MGLGKTILLGLAGVVLGLGVAFVLVGLPLWHRYSRKKLLSNLQAYFSGQPIQHGIAKNRMFRGFVQYGKWNADIRRKIKKSDHGQ